METGEFLPLCTTCPLPNHPAFFSGESERARRACYRPLLAFDMGMAWCLQFIQPPNHQGSAEDLQIPSMDLHLPPPDSAGQLIHSLL